MRVFFLEEERIFKAMKKVSIFFGIIFLLISFLLSFSLEASASMEVESSVLSPAVLSNELSTTKALPQSNTVLLAANTKRQYFPCLEDNCTTHFIMLIVELIYTFLITSFLTYYSANVDFLWVIKFFSVFYMFFLAICVIFFEKCAMDMAVFLLGVLIFRFARIVFDEMGD